MAEGLIGVIGGSGLGEAMREHIEDIHCEEVDTPFGKPSDPIAFGKLGKRQVAFLNRHGQGHRYHPSVVPYAANIFALKKLGVKSVITTAAVGSLQDEIAPGDLVVVDQFIDKTFRRQSSFFDDFGAVHCEFAHPCCEGLRQAIISCADKVSAKVHLRGTYVCMEGPQFSTRAESFMHRQWGGDLIGMTALPEAKLAREAQMSYSLISLVSDYDCWKEHAADAGKHQLLEEIIGNLEHATNNAIELIKAVLSSDAELIDENWPARKSLEMAVWTKDDAIDPKQRNALEVLFE